jgi:hypothetical protein
MPEETDEPDQQRLQDIFDREDTRSETAASQSRSVLSRASVRR